MNLGGIWREFSQDEFIRWESGILAARIHPARSRRTNSSGYEFIQLDLAGRIHQATNSSGYEFIGLRSHQVRIHGSRLTNLTGYEFDRLRIHRATNSSSEISGVLAWRIWRATNSTGYEFIGLRIHRVRSLEFSPDEFIGLRIHQARFSLDEFIKWELAGTNWWHRRDDSHPSAVARSACAWFLS